MGSLARHNGQLLLDPPVESNRSMLESIAPSINYVGKLL